MAKSATYAYFAIFSGLSHDFRPFGRLRDRSGEPVPLPVAELVEALKCSDKSLNLRGRDLG